MNLTAFSMIAGVPIRYARTKDHPYGTQGKPRTQQVTEEFLEKLDDCFTELWNVCPHGKAESITSGGAYVEKAGRHGEGRAIDIDAIWWANKVLITAGYNEHKRFYLGVEAIIRRHLGTVLGYLYNKAHHDHWHIDDGTEVKFTIRSRSRVMFMQAALLHIWGKHIAIDGIYGPATDGALRTCLDVNASVSYSEVWREWLLRTAVMGMGQKKEG